MRDDEPEDPEPQIEVDLHGHTPEQALRKLARELHAARIRGAAEILVITGRGLGNRANKPLLRAKVEDWLRHEGRQRLGVESFSVTARGGALLVRLRAGGAR